jgi:hypothetical protein
LEINSVQKAGWIDLEMPKLYKEKFQAHRNLPELFARNQFMIPTFSIWRISCCLTEETCQKDLLTALSGIDKLASGLP